MQTRLTLLGRVGPQLERRSAPSMETTGAGIYSRQSLPVCPKGAKKLTANGPASAKPSARQAANMNANRRE
jgi:hypothetical protein